jgi:hypothetical protein
MLFLHQQFFWHEVIFFLVYFLMFLTLVFYDIFQFFFTSFLMPFVRTFLSNLYGKILYNIQLGTILHYVKDGGHYQIFSCLLVNQLRLDHMETRNQLVKFHEFSHLDHQVPTISVQKEYLCINYFRVVVSI